ncbi:hypothetical protein ES703_70133 [subsurface metagenome]
MRRVAKVLILVVLIVLVVAHHAVIHDGAFYDLPDLLCHETIISFMAGMIAAIVLWGKKK